MLERPERRQRLSVRQRAVQDPVRIEEDRLGELLPVVGVNQNGPAGQCAEVDADDVMLLCVRHGHAAYPRFRHSGQM